MQKSPFFEGRVGKYSREARGHGVIGFQTERHQFCAFQPSPHDEALHALDRQHKPERHADFEQVLFESVTKGNPARSGSGFGVPRPRSRGRSLGLDGRPSQFGRCRVASLPQKRAPERMRSPGGAYDLLPSADQAIRRGGSCWKRVGNFVIQSPQLCSMGHVERPFRLRIIVPLAACRTEVYSMIANKGFAGSNCRRTLDRIQRALLRFLSRLRPAILGCI